VCSVLGALVPGLAVGTSVVPINPRHPLLVTAAAQTAQAASGGRFSLGLGLGVKMLEELTFGISKDQAAQRLREYLKVVLAVRDTGTVEFRGEHIVAVDPQVMPVALPGQAPYPVYVAAMGPRTLQVTGELADGTLSYAGPRTLEQFVVPAITAAAAGAGRPAPRIFGLLSVAVTDDPDAARAVAAQTLAIYDQVPSYQRINQREGVDSVVDLALIGSAGDIAAGLQRYLDAGATDLLLMPIESGRDAWHRVCDLAAGIPHPRGGLESGHDRS